MSATDNTSAFDLDQVERDLSEHGESTVQFDNPIGETLAIVSDDGGFDPEKWPQVSSADYLVRLNAMCMKWGPKLTVRFYGHHSEVFDGKSVLAIPEARSLSVDGIYEATNVEAIAELQHLERFHLGIFELDDKAALSKLPLERLTHLTLSATETKALDLAPIANARKLHKLYLDGHHKNIAALSALDDLKEFTFNPKKGLDPSFINGMTNLRSLKFNLGGTESIAEIALPKLEDIAFTMLRGLTNLDGMERFPALRRVFVQDQKQLESAQFGAANNGLEHLWFDNCPNVGQIEGLADCPKLKSLRWLFTETDPASLDLPKSLTHLHMLSGKRKTEDAEKATIEALGYVADDHDDSWFFYK